ncbi:MAG TPA: DNA-3-methyladenine glycosylase I [Candidatus Polarisedimenticolia bacterium]|nr:DNA-3-methyladenine glycosylase I [Candidatus Polarisedimenticolia bacterium]
MPSRCAWADGDPRLARYHDREWGVPVRTSRAHLERISLEVFQAGLSWRLILAKRSALRRAFARFQPARVARFTRRDVDRLMSDPGIVRNRMKIEATIRNARRVLELARLHGSVDRWLDEAGRDREALFAALRRELEFMGPLVAESYLQSIGRLPAPHQRGCFLRPARRPARRRAHDRG